LAKAWSATEQEPSHLLGSDPWSRIRSRGRWSSSRRASCRRWSSAPVSGRGGGSRRREDRSMFPAMKKQALAMLGGRAMADRPLRSQGGTL